MRLAIFSDIHGNPIALDAVLNDIQAQGGVDNYLVLGDMAAIGYDPATVLDMLADLPNALFVRGNTDRYLLTNERPSPTQEDIQNHPEMMPLFISVGNSFAWTQGYLAATGWLDWLAALPLEQRLVLQDGTRLLGVHASPGNDDGYGLHPSLSDIEFQATLSGCEADLVVVGHTHWVMDRRVDGVRVVNVGSVGNPKAPDLRASYVMLESNSTGHQIEFRRVDYNRQAVIDAVHKVKHPAGTYIIKFMQAQIHDEA